MARIRTIKPDFFRDEDLQDLERANPGKYCMMVFSGLWGHCDKLGHFEWKPRTLKLDILPFLDFDMSDTLSLLQKGGFIRHYSVGGADYGDVPTFLEHQRISGKEAQEDARFPGPQQRKTKKQSGSSGEAPVKHLGRQEGKGRGREMEEEGKGDAGQKTKEIISSSLSKSAPITNSTEKAQKKARWEQKISEEIYRTLPNERACKIVTAYTLDEKWAKDEFEKVDKLLKLKRGAA